MVDRKKEIERNIRRAFAVAREVAKHPDRFPDRFIVLPLDADTVEPLFTRQRIRLLRALREEGPFDSVSALARRLRRDQTRVGRDLEQLVGAGLAQVHRRGKSKVVSAERRPIVLA